MESPYDILRVDPDADEAEIERAYRRRAKETHPDQGGSAGEFRAVAAAYEAIRSGSRGYGDDAAGEPPGDRSDSTGGRRSHSAGGGRSHSAAGDRSSPSGGDRTDRTESRVEYVDYEVLDDHGWEIDDDALFEKASAADLDAADHGRFLVRSDESLLEAAENRGFAWPYACRGGACANCAVAVTEGELSMPANHVLPPEMIDRGIRLSCNGRPTTDEMKVVYNVKHLPDLDELRLPPRPFEAAHLDD